MKKQEFFVYDYKEMEEQIIKVYNQKYDIVASEELGNGSNLAYEMEIDERYTRERVISWLGIKKFDNWMLRSLLQDMVNNHNLPEGNYLIRIYW
jgi:hypothetical protein